MLDNKDYIKTIVEEFYQKAINDFMIGYHFRKIQSSPGDHPLQATLGQFAHHLPRIIQFWEIQLLGKTDSQESMNFDLIKVHQALSVRRGEVNRWIMLFQETLNENENHALKDKWNQRVTHFQETFLKKLFNH